MPKGIKGFQKGQQFTEEHRQKLSLAKIGKTPSNKGVPSSPEKIAKMSAALKGHTPWNKGLKYIGRPHSPETRAHLSELAKAKVAAGVHRFGDGSKSGATDRFKNSHEYKEWRRKVFERDDYTCQACGARGGILHPDHIFPKSLFPDLALDLSNGRTLCIPCHKATVTYAKNISQLTTLYSFGSVEHLGC